MSGCDLFVPLPGQAIDWTAFTVVIPSVSVGNVPQLAVDLLINSLLERKQVQLVGRIRTPCFRPIAGPNPYDIFSPHPSSSCEVYVSSVHKLVILQIRTPPFPETKVQLIQTLSKWILDQQFSRTVVLSSSFSQCLTEPDLDISGQTIKYVLTTSAAGAESALEKSGSRRLSPQQITTSSTESFRLPGSGFGLTLFHKLEESGLNAVLLVSFCSEGDNRPEAASLVGLVSSALFGMDCNRWVEPVSWTDMFGSEKRSDIF